MYSSQVSLNDCYIDFPFMDFDLFIYLLKAHEEIAVMHVGPQTAPYSTIKRCTWLKND